MWLWLHPQPWQRWQRRPSNIWKKNWTTKAVMLLIKKLANMIQRRVRSFFFFIWLASWQLRSTDSDPIWATSPSLCKNWSPKSKHTYFHIKTNLLSACIFFNTFLPESPRGDGQHSRCRNVSQANAWWLSPSGHQMSMLAGWSSKHLSRRTHTLQVNNTFNTSGFRSANA